MNSKNVQTSECNELLLLFNSSSSFCLSSISVKMVLLAYLKEIQCAHHQLQFIKDRLEILHKSNPIAMEILLSKFFMVKMGMAPVEMNNIRGFCGAGSNSQD